MQPSYAKQLDAINFAQQKLEAKRFRTLEKALRSDKPEDMVKASQVIAAIQNKSNKKRSRSSLTLSSSMLILGIRINRLLFRTLHFCE